MLFKSHYLAFLSDPEEHGAEHRDYDWPSAFEQVYNMARLLSGNFDLQVKRRYIRRIHDTIFDVLCICGLRGLRCYKNNTLLGILFERLKPKGMNYPDCIGTLLDPGFNEGIISANKNAILCCSELFRADDGYGGPLEDDVFQQSAKLHCFKGMPIPADDAKTMDTFYYDRAVPFARSKVYDLRSYTAKTRWGPFRKDGSLDVDWVMVEAIMIVLSWNTAVLKTVPESWWESDVFNVPWHQGDFYQAHRANIDESPASYYPENRDFSLDSQDPYGVTGRYRRVWCFMYFQDFDSFNQGLRGLGLDADEPGPPIDDGDVEEALGHFTMRLKVTKVYSPEQSSTTHPVVHFRGTSKVVYPNRTVPNPVSRIIGHVQVTPQGEVRWTTISILDGEERYHCEGIQVGGIRSYRGVIGTWFDKTFGENGRAGPTVFWKESEDISDLELNDWGFWGEDTGVFLPEPA